ncbi:MAG: CdaR family protein [Clostridia bacterium]|nr:CdaR family protein [Clostridia bacterium]
MNREELKTVTDVEQNEVEAKADRKKQGLMIFPRIVCVLLALILWIYVINITSTDAEKTINLIQIKIEGAEALKAATGFSIYDQSEAKVSITVRGKRQDIQEISENGFYAFVDVSGITTGGKHTLPVKVSIPETVSLVSTSPSSIDLFTDSNITKSVPVTVGLSSYSISDNYSFGEIRPTVNSVLITGPATVLDRIVTAKAEVNLSSAWVTSGFVHNAELSFLDKNGDTVDKGFISSDRTNIDVAVSVIMKAELKLSVSYENGFDRSKVTDYTVDPTVLTVYGPPEKVSSLQKISVLTVGELTPAENTVQVSSLTLPPDVYFLNAPEEIRVRLIFAPVTTEPETTPLSPETLPEPEETLSPAHEVTAAESSVTDKKSI